MKVPEIGYGDTTFGQFNDNDEREKDSMKVKKNNLDSPKVKVVEQVVVSVIIPANLEEEFPTATGAILKIDGSVDPDRAVVLLRMAEARVLEEAVDSYLLDEDDEIEDDEIEDDDLDPDGDEGEYQVEDEVEDVPEENS